jgi:NAD(P)-dependent dehydrogenase (short-subunit alcohol dehydrogenase family)
LGKALVAALAGRGWAVITDARDARALQAAIDEIRSRSGGATAPLLAIPGDITDPAHRGDLVEAAHDLGRLDLVVNNAGGLGPSPLPALAQYPVDELAGLFDVNVAAPLALLQLALPLLRASHGTVVNITSDAGVEGYPGWGGYGATKAALDQLSRVLAAEEPDLVVYAIDPGDLRTQMHQDAFPGEDISDRPLPETSIPGILAIIDERLPSGRYQARQQVPA